MDCPTKLKKPAAGKSACRPRTAAPFKSDDELLEAAIPMFESRHRHRTTVQEGDATEETVRALRKQAVAWTRSWHKSFQMTEDSVVICRRSRECHLNELDREVLTVLLLNCLGLLPERAISCGGLLNVLGLAASRKLKAVRAISENGRLVRRGLLTYDDPEEELITRTPVVDSLFVETVLSGNPRASTGWKVKSETQLYGRLESLSRHLMEKSDAIRGFKQGFGPDVHKWTRMVGRELDWLESIFHLHPGWKLTTLCQNLKPRQKIVLLALLGKELGHVDANELLFTGGGLARAAADKPDSVHAALRLLMANGSLIKKDLIQPCGGLAEVTSNNPGELEQTEFELTEKAVGILQLNKGMRRKRPSEFASRPAKVRMDQLVFSDRVQRGLNLALVHARHLRRLVDQWGLGEMIPYGHSPVLLFSGAPGTGKTAAAEALANALDKPILVADYSRIQNCFVGQTEKNVVRVFREARNQDAVLFWDEADAMFFDRDSATPQLGSPRCQCSAPGD